MHNGYTHEHETRYITDPKRLNVNIALMSPKFLHTWWSVLAAIRLIVPQRASFNSDSQCVIKYK